MSSTPPSGERKRRLRAAPLGLLLLSWGLGVGPLAHALLAHGEPRLHDSGDRGWVAHLAQRGAEPAQRDTPSLPHRHAPGAPEHLQLAFSAGAVTLTVAAVNLALAAAALIAGRPPVLERWRLPEVPGAP